MILYKKLYSITIITLIIVGAALFAVYVELDTIDFNAIGEFRAATRVAEQPSVPLTLTEKKLTTKTYFYGSSLVASKEGSVIYYHDDYLGSTRVQTDSSAKKLYAARTAPFGSDIYTSGAATGADNSFKFTGQESDDDLYYYGARYYDTKSGRFTQIDPIADESSPYRYADNNPIRYSDPNGASVWDSIKYNWKPVVIGAAVGTLAYHAAAWENPVSTTSGRISLGVLAVNTPMKVLRLVNSYRYRGKESVYASSPSPDRISMNDVGQFTTFFREYGGDEGREVAAAIESTVSRGLAFSSPHRMPNGEIDIYENSLTTINGIDLGYKPVGTYGFVYNKQILDIMLYTKHMQDAAYAEYDVSIFAHEGLHLTQSPLRNFINDFFNIPYNSRFNLVEEPARRFADKMRNSYYDMYRPGSYDNYDNQMIDSPPSAELDSMNNA